MGVDIATLGLILDGRQMRAESARVSASLATVGKTGATVTKTMLRLGASIGALIAFRAATKLAGDFTTAMTRSLAIMGDVDDMMRNRLSMAARQVGIDLNLGATQAAEAFFFLASAGLDAEQSLAALVPVATFAKAGMFGMALATDLATDAQSALGLRTNETAQDIENLIRVTDVLVKANTIANATVEQFATSLTTEAGAALKIFSKDVEEGVAVLAVFADQGVKGQVAGSALSRILRIMTAAAVNNKEAYEKMNISVFDAEGAVRNFADIIEDLEGALGDLSDEQRVAALQTLGFMARIQGVINPLIGASEQLRVYEAQLRSAGGITQEVADKQLQAPMERAGAAMKVFADVGITAGMNILRVLVPALEALAANAGLVVDVLLTMAVALVALKIGALVPGILAASVAAFAFASNLIFVTVTAATASAALLNLSILLGPAALLIAGVALVAAGFFLWRRRIRETREELERQEQVIQKDTDRIKVLTDVNLELAKAQAIRLLTEAMLARSAGTITEEEEIRATRFLNILRQTSLEIKKRADAEAEAAARSAAIDAAGGVEAGLAFIGSQEETAGRELTRITALNDAFGESQGVLDRINLDFERQAKLLDIATNAELENLAALTKVTNEIFDQKERQLELNEAKEQSILEGDRERELAAIKAQNDAIGESAAEQARLNIELQRTAQLARDAEQFSGQALTDALNHTKALFDERLRTIELTEAEKERELLADASKAVERQLLVNEATEAGGDALAKLNVELARKAALDQNGKRASGETLLALNATTNQIFDLRLALTGLNDEFDKGSKLPELYAEALRQIQGAFAGGFDSIIKDGLSGFEDMANNILNIFQDLAVNIAAALAADALGLDDIVKTLSEGGELSRGQQIAAGVGFGAIGGGLVGQATGGGSTGSKIGGAIGGGIGTALGGPIGGAVGSVIGGAIGGLFGGGPSKEEVNDFIKSLERIKVALEPASFIAAADAIGDATRDILFDFKEVFDIKDLRDKFKDATGRAIGDLSSDTLVKDLTAFQNSFSAGSKEFKAIGLIADAARLQLEALRKEQAKQARDFDVNLRVREAQISGDKVGALTAAAIAQQQDELDAAQELVNQGTITQDMFNRLARVLDQELAAAIESVEESTTSLLESLMDFQQSLLFGPTSTLSPTQQLEEARRQFESTRTAALGGDAAAAAELPAVSQRLLDLSRQVNASGAGFVEDFERVQSTVQLVIDQFDVQKEVQEEILVETRIQTIVVQEIRDDARLSRDEQREAELAILFEFRKAFPPSEDRTGILVTDSGQEQLL